MWELRPKGLRRQLVWRFLSNCMSELWMLDLTPARLIRICGRGIKRVPAPSIAAPVGIQRFPKQGVWVVSQWVTLTWPHMRPRVGMLFEISLSFQSYNSR